jgi:hypothetical protein
MTSRPTKPGAYLYRPKGEERWKVVSIISPKYPGFGPSSWFTDGLVNLPAEDIPAGEFLGPLDLDAVADWWRDREEDGDG